MKLLGGVVREGLLPRDEQCIVVREVVVDGLIARSHRDGPKEARVWVGNRIHRTKFLEPLDGLIGKGWREVRVTVRPGEALPGGIVYVQLGDDRLTPLPS